MYPEVIEGDLIEKVPAVSEEKVNLADGDESITVTEDSKNSSECHEQNELTEKPGLKGRKLVISNLYGDQFAHFKPSTTNRGSLKHEEGFISFLLMSSPMRTTVVGDS